jgi:hypothetical protein
MGYCLLLVFAIMMWTHQDNGGVWDEWENEESYWIFVEVLKGERCRRKAKVRKGLGVRQNKKVCWIQLARERVVSRAFVTNVMYDVRVPWNRKFLDGLSSSGFEGKPASFVNW